METSSHENSSLTLEQELTPLFTLAQKEWHKAVEKCDGKFSTSRIKDKKTGELFQIQQVALTTTRNKVDIHIDRVTLLDQADEKTSLRQLDESYVFNGEGGDKVVLDRYVDGEIRISFGSRKDSPPSILVDSSSPGVMSSTDKKHTFERLSSFFGQFSSAKPKK